MLTLAILTDDSPAWRPETYKLAIWNMEVILFRFQSVKLLDYTEKKHQLEKITNPFGIVVLAQLAAIETKQQAQDRLVQKFALTRRLYDRGLERDAILNLYRFIDWVHLL